MKKRIAILGSTGSIGTQTLDVIGEFPDRFEVVGLTAHSRVDLLAEQIRRHSPQFVGVGLIVAAFSNTVSQAFIIANFPLIFFMFFSGAIYPLPQVQLFEVAGRVVGLYDLIPPTHAVIALNKILTLGAGLGEVLYELVSLVLLSIVYFAIGTWLFHRRHMQIT